MTLAETKTTFDDVYHDSVTQNIIKLHVATLQMTKKTRIQMFVAISINIFLNANELCVSRCFN